MDSPPIIRKATPATSDHAAVNGDGRRRFVLSTGSRDRIGDEIVQSGWKLAAFAKHPIALFAHRSDEPIGRWHDVAVDNGALIGTLELLPAESSPRAKLASAILDNGFPIAVSVGFRPLKSELLDPADPWGGRRYVESELLEASLVCVPANADALALALRSLDLPPDLLNEVSQMDAPAAVTEPAAPVVTEPAAPAAPVIAPVLRAVAAPLVAPGLKTPRAYSLKNVMRALAGDIAADIGFEAEVGRECSLRMDSERPGFHIPLSVMLGVAKASGTTAGSGGAGGVGIMGPLAIEDLLDVTAIGAALQKQLITGQAGITILSTNERSIRIPTVSTKPNIDVVAIDAVVGVSDSTFGAAVLNPVTAGGRVSVLRSAMYAHGGEEVIRNLLARALVEKLDECVLIGHTAPNLEGLTAASPATQATVSAATAGQDIDAVLHEADTYLGTPGIAKIIASTLTLGALTRTPAWTGSAIAVTATQGSLRDRPAFGVLAMPGSGGPPATGYDMLAGDFRFFNLASFGPGAVLEANPYLSGLWEKGAFELRVLADFSAGWTDKLAVKKTTVNIL